MICICAGTCGCRYVCKIKRVAMHKENGTEDSACKMTGTHKTDKVQ